MRKESLGIGPVEFPVLAFSALEVIISFIATKNGKEMRSCLVEELANWLKAVNTETKY